jgi:serine/threonine protein kinase
VTPGNILFESHPHSRVALSDFGIASILAKAEPDVTRVAGEFAGSPGYMAPELIKGYRAEPAAALRYQPTFQSDIYSLGVVVYEMICKRLPFDEHQGVFATIKAKVERDAPDIRNFRPDVPEPVAQRLGQVLAREPSLRPTSARGVLFDLEETINDM